MVMIGQKKLPQFAKNVSKPTVANAGPESGTTFATVGLLTFLANWGNFFWPIMTIYEPPVMPIALSIGYVGPNPSLGVILALPALTLFVVSQRWFIRSITSGAINE